MADTQNESKIAARVDDVLDGARLRILIVGAGIAGATLAALLNQRGEPAAIIERTGPDAEEGYMLGILPLGGRALNGLGLRDEYIAASTPVADYSMYGHHGKMLQTMSTDEIVKRFGIYNGIARGAFLDLLRSRAGDVIYRATVDSIEHPDGRASGVNRGGVTVTFNDGSHTTVDLVVAADGIHSTTRPMILHDDEVEHFDSGWGGYVCWCDTVPGQEHSYREMWGTGWFLGLYPVPGRTGVFLGGPADVVRPMDPFEYAKELIGHDLPEPFGTTLKGIDHSHKPVYWPMADIRARVWWRDRVVLLGDAASAFLPTAGVGASAAMDAASALADELSRADADHIDFALTLYERRQRDRTELAQKNSRQLSKLMFESSALATFTRDQLARFYPGSRTLDDIAKVMEGRS